eukprot:532807_1
MSSFCLKTLIKLLKQYKNVILPSRFNKLMAIMIFVEFIFYVRWKYLVYYVNNFIPHTIVKSSCNHKRLQSIHKYSSLYNEYNKTSRIEWVKYAFNNYPLNEIKKQNMIQVLAARYFLKYDNEVKSNLTAEEIEWRDNLILKTFERLEKQINYKFEEGFNPNVKSAKYPVNPITTFYHPLLFYLCIYIGKIQANFIFSYYLKFSSKYINGLKVWYKLNKTKTTDIDKLESILIFGGVGAANPAQSILFVNRLLKRYNNKNIFVIEIPWSEMKINHFIPFCGYINNNIALSMDEITDILFQIEDMVLVHNDVTNDEKILKLQWNLLGQSFGSFMCSCIYQNIKDKHMGVIPRLILIDAPTLCMTDPVLTKLINKSDIDWKRYLFQIFVGQELMVATMGAKYFHWFEYCLFPHDLVNDGCYKSHIIVSGTKDHLIPFKTIKKGVEEANKLCENDKEIKHIIMDGVLHGAWISHKKYQNDVIDLL